MNGGIISNVTTLLKLLRFSNILFLLYLQVSIYWLLDISGLDTSIGCTQYLLTIVLPTFFTLAYGYAHNDMCDIASDQLNNKRPVAKGDSSLLRLSQVEQTLFLGLILSVLIVSFYSSWMLLGVYIASYAMLYCYNIYLKCRPLLGNITVGLLCIVGVFIPILTFSYEDYIVDMEPSISEFLIHFGVLIFLFTILRELIKDIQDIKGDTEVQCETHPVKYGIDKTRGVVYFISFITFLTIIHWICKVSLEMSVYISLLALVPFIVFLLTFSKSAKYDKLSALLKVQMLLASLLVFLYTTSL